MIDLMSEFPNIEFVFADAPSNNIIGCKIMFLKFRMEKTIL